MIRKDYEQEVVLPQGGVRATMGEAGNTYDFIGDKGKQNQNRYSLVGPFIQSIYKIPGIILLMNEA